MREWSRLVLAWGEEAGALVLRQDLGRPLREASLAEPLAPGLLAQSVQLGDRASEPGKT
jgi:hypothetical protein